VRKNESSRIGTRVLRGLVAGAAVLGIVATSIVGLDDVADHLAVPHSSAQASTEG
jgi:hypothetical protein